LEEFKAMRIFTAAFSITTCLLCAGEGGAQDFSKDPLTVTEKFSFFEQPVFGPRAAALISLTAGLRMLNAPDRYPHEWRDGVGAYSRNVGDHYARHAAQNTASFVASAVLHENPRYVPATGTALLGRVAHAIGFTLIDRTDGGHSTLAVSNFAGAAAGGFVGNGYMPDGYNDVTHAGQRALGIMGGVAGRNLAAEFGPDIARMLRKLGISTTGKIPIPEWWTSK
jgi:hypothetical protein